ncbi:PREDICTED: uncharacterized protein LOC109472567 [Branchiostoma belcheri]|uniref:Uncharacterized protein LOC109472567 n=1 Tax=Branchiostoma belcheri TaxID=7741 RepID=A0A6P4ZE40_BRABE|nr:PREDICTED: uncharacterized protein LOC109472567 [Branchiostoma belcheri]
MAAPPDNFGPPGAAFSPCCPPSIQSAVAAVSLRPSIQPAAAAVSLRPSIQPAAAAVSLRPSIQPAAASLCPSIQPAAASLCPSIQPAAVPCPPSMQCWPVAVPAPLCPQPGVSGPVTSNRVTVDLNEEGPLTPDQQAALCAMVKRQMVDKALYVKTGGKPLHFVQVPVSQKKSSEAAPSTLQKRAQRVSDFREKISGGSGEEQMAAELKRLSRDRLLQVLQEGGFAQIRIPDGHLLGAKSGLNLNWGQCRSLRRWMREYGVVVESEQTSRRIAADLLSATTVVAENLPFTTKDDDGTKRVEPRPCAFLSSLVAAVHDFLERSKKAGKLTWHRGGIPEIEIWLKIGGDHGGTTFKMAFQPLNIKHPNSKANTSVFCLFESKDSRENITTALARYKGDLKKLEEEMWKSEDGETYQVKILMTGDYAYMSTIYGISGAAGTYPCLWCKITKAGIDDPDNRTLRTSSRDLDNMGRRFSRDFIQRGQGRLRRAQDFRNIIAAPLFDIPLEQAIVPGLHISLGIFLRLYQEFEAAVQDLDLKVQAYLRMLVLSEPNNREEIMADQELGPFQRYVDAIDGAQKYRLEADELDQTIEEQEDQLAFLAYQMQVDDEMAEVVFAEAASMVSDLVRKRDSLRKKEEEILSKASVKPGKGPLASKLEPVMKTFKVRREMYHSRTFVGNHVNRMLHDKPIEDLTSSVVNTMVDLSHDIKEFMSHYRRDSKSVSIKMHLLEDHVVPCIRHWGFGLGFLAEQGIEEVHAQFNHISQSTRSIADPVARLKATLKAHLLKVSPDHTGKIPEPVKRKRTL